MFLNSWFFHPERRITLQELLLGMTVNIKAEPNIHNNYLLLGLDSWYLDPWSGLLGTEAHPEARGNTCQSGCLPRTESEIIIMKIRHKIDRNITSITYDSSKHLVEHCAKTPPVDLITVRRTLDDLRSKVLGSATESACHIIT